MPTFPSSTLVFENAALRVLTHPSNFVILQHKPGTRQLADVLAGFEQVGTVFNAHDWHALLSDQRLMSPITPTENAAVNEYLETYFRQRGRGMLVAVLVAHDVFARLASSQFRHVEQHLSHAITYHIFEEEAPALAWLTG